MNPPSSERILGLAFVGSVLVHLLLLFLLDRLFLRDLEASERTSGDPERTMVLLELDALPEIFVDADPSRAEEEKPESTPYYSTIDALAGDSSPEDSLDVPALDGSQTSMWKTRDTPPEAMARVTESAAVGENSTEIPTSAPATGSLPSSLPPGHPVEGIPEEPVGLAGEDASRVPDDESRAEQPPAATERPRTLAEALRQQEALVGRKREQEGGVSRFRLEATPDLLATPFGEYDAAIIRAIQSRWYAILDRNPAVRNARGKVILKFLMKSDGSIDRMEVVEDSVGFIQSLACQQAVSDPAPYRPWPGDLLRLLPTGEREVRFSFFYN